MDQDDYVPSDDAAKPPAPLRLGTPGSGAGSTAAKAEEARLDREATQGPGNRAERRARGRK